MANGQPDNWQKLTVAVDSEVCEGYGVCVGIDDNLFELDEHEDTVIIRSQPASAEEFSIAQSAVQRCPKRALRLEPSADVVDETAK